MSAESTKRGESSATGVEPERATESELELPASDPRFPTLPDAPVSSKVRKAKVRAALFRKLAPVRVGRFILLEQLGAGAMGEIYAAYDEQLDRRVALKLVRHGSELTIKADDMLLREAQALAQVSHPNVVQIYEAGEHDGRLFIAMELIHGQTLTRWLDETKALPRPQRQREILRRFIAAGRGLEAAHTAGVAHRDFKPDNVLVGDDGRVRVVDFGLARAFIGDVAPGATARSPGAAMPDFAHGQTVRMGAGGGACDAPLDSAVSAVAFATDATTLGHGGRAGGATDPTAEASIVDGPAAGDTSPAAGDTSPAAGDTSPAVGDTSPAAASAPRLRAATRLTEPGTVMGTPRYMAPEQIRGVVADHRSDQFSFCVALYHALYGVFPYAGERMPELLDSMETGAIGLEHSAGVAAGLRKALRRGLSVDPSQRFPTMGQLLAALEPGLRRRGGWVAGAVLLFVVVGVVSWRLSSADPCSTAGNGIGLAWSPDRRAATQAAFLRSDLPYAEAAWRGASQRLDDYAARWRGEAIGACHATNVDHVQSAQLFDRRMLCLDHGRRQVAALAGELVAGAPDAIQHAVQATEALSDPRACSHTESIMFGLEPPPAAIAHDVAAVREQLARALALENLGRTEESLTIARAARLVSERLPYPPVQAEALAQVARALDGRATAEARTESEVLYFQALDLAEAHRHDLLAAVIWNRLVRLATRMDPGTGQAHAWWRRNEAAVRRIGATAIEQARLHHLLSELDYRDGRYAEAVDEANRAITAIAGLANQELELSQYYDVLARALERQDRFDEAFGLREQALKIVGDSLGASHPRLIKLQIGYGRALAKRGQPARARSVLEAALSSMPAKYRETSVDAAGLLGFLSELACAEGRLDDAATYGRESLRIYQSTTKASERHLAEAYVDLGNVELRRKHFAEALAMYSDALELRHPHLSRDHYQLGVNEGSIADALVGLARYDEAIVHVHEAERIFEHSAAEDRETRAWILTVHGEALVGLHQLEAAVALLERALPLFEGALDPSNPPRAEWALARALHGLGRDASRVRQLAELARGQFAALGPPEAANRDTVKSFLEQLSPVPTSSSPRLGDRITK